MTAASFNELFGLGSHSPDANLENWYPLQDNAANTTILDRSGHSRNATNAANTNDKTTAGPNGWLSAALAYNGSTDYSAFARQISNDFTILTRFKTSQSGSGGSQWYYGDALVDGEVSGNFNDFGTSVLSNGVCLGIGSTAPANERSVIGATSVVDNAWRHFAATRVNATGALQVFLDAVSDGTGTAVNTGSLTAPTNLNIGRSPSAYAPSYFNGSQCDVSIWSRVLASSEIGQAKDGPEPINTVAPTQSGSATVGAAQSCTTGTWGLVSPFSGGSNGTITYTYRWTASTDGSGTGETNISGATSSTYTPVSGDVGKYLRCWVRASNNGGYDAAADTPTAFSGAIASSGGAANSGRLLLLGCGE